MEYNRKRHAVYMCTYHMVFVANYRKPVINNEVGDFMKAQVNILAANMGGQALSVETDTDHIHILVSLPPDIPPTQAVNVFKTQLSRAVHSNEKLMQHVGKYHYGDCPLWSASYFLATTGSVSMETVKSYIEAQRTEEHKRKYEHSGKYKGVSKKKK